VKKYKIEERLVCYTADNTNSNFGDAKRKWNENVFRKVQSDLYIYIYLYRHNSVQTACDSLPLDIEVIVIKNFMM
jgi:hypothetical protein